MQCGRCSDKFAVTASPSTAPRAGRWPRPSSSPNCYACSRIGSPSLDAPPPEHKQAFADSGVLPANYQSTLSEGFSALETYLKARFTSDGPTVSLKGQGAVFQRLDDAAALYRDHLDAHLPR